MLSFETAQQHSAPELPATAPKVEGSPSKIRQYLALGLTLVAGVLIIGTIITGSGASESTEARPKAILFLVDGLKATVIEEIGVHGYRAPNLQRLVAAGSHAACYGSSDVRCCRTQSGAKLGAPFSFTSAPGLLSALTGVDASKHQVYNSSFDAMMRYATTSQQYPTLMKRLVDAGLRATAIGSDSMLTVVGSSGSCNAYGVVDFECGASALNRCQRSSSCNLIERVTVSADVSYDKIVADIDRLMNSGSDFIVVHLTRANTAATTRGSFTSPSMPYAAEIYKIDAVIGQTLAIIERRSRAMHENWLILGTSDHGGHGSEFGTRLNDDELIPFFAHVRTPAGVMPLRDPTSPVRQMDVAPTVLEWFDLLNSGASASMDGKVQFLCGTGAAGGNCSSAGLV